MELNPYFVGVSIFLFGLIIGSFLNVVIYRLPRRESVVFPSSHCTSCNTSIKAYDNIPVLSYALLGGKCRNCRVGISPLYPAVELLVAFLYLLACDKKRFRAGPPARWRHRLFIVSGPVDIHRPATQAVAQQTHLSGLCYNAHPAHPLARPLDHRAWRSL